MPRTYPSDFTKVDRKMAKMLTPDDVFVTDMLVLYRWMDGEGGDRWGVYNATADCVLSSKIGLLELGKVELMNRPGIFRGVDELDEEEVEDE